MHTISSETVIDPTILLCPWRSGLASRILPRGWVMTTQAVCSKTLRQKFTALVQFARTRPRNQRRTDCTDFENYAFQSLAFKSLYCIRSL